MILLLYFPYFLLQLSMSVGLSICAYSPLSLLFNNHLHIDGLAQDCSKPSALRMLSHQYIFARMLFVVIYIVIYLWT